MQLLHVLSQSQVISSVSGKVSFYGLLTLENMSIIVEKLQFSGKCCKTFLSFFDNIYKNALPILVSKWFKHDQRNILSLQILTIIVGMGNVGGCDWIKRQFPSYDR